MKKKFTYMFFPLNMHRREIWLLAFFFLILRSQRTAVLYFELKHTAKITFDRIFYDSLTRDIL